MTTLPGASEYPSCPQHGYVADNINAEQVASKYAGEPTFPLHK